MSKEKLSEKQLWVLENINSMLKFGNVFAVWYHHVTINSLLRYGLIVISTNQEIVLTETGIKKLKKLDK